MRKTIFTGTMVLIAVAAANAANVTLPLATVVEASDRQTKTFPAKVLPVQRVDITPDVSGDIIEVCFKDGALVKAGDILYRLMPIRYNSALRNAEAKVAECKARKAYADAAYERHASATNRSARAVSLNAVDSAKSDRETAVAALAAAEAELAVADYNLKRCEIRTPINGRAGTTRLTKGNPASPSTPLVTVVQIQPIRVRFSLSNADYLTMFGARSRTLAEKAEISVMLANGTTYAETGTIDHTENITDEATDTIRVYATFPNADFILKPYASVGVTLRNKDGAKKCAIPPAAVMQDPDGACVWVVRKDGKAEKRRIVRGRMQGDLQLVESGLAIGEQVVADGTHKVSPGDTITATK